MDKSSIIGLGLPIIESTSIIESIIESIMLVISLDIAVQNRAISTREIDVTTYVRFTRRDGTSTALSGAWPTRPIRETPDTYACDGY